jgi:hypothetical protein
MVLRSVFRGTLASLALLWAGTAWGATINSGAVSFTGLVEKDFDPLTNQSVRVVSDAANDVAQAQWITDRGWISGWNIKDLRTSYNPATDTLAVGVNFFGIAGDADGNRDPGKADPLTLAAGGVDLEHLGGRKSISVAIDTNNSGTPAIVAGVPADKSTAGPGVDGFTVAAYKNSNQGIASSYGPTLTDHLGELAFDPSQDHPGFEFTIKNFSTLPGLDLTKGFGIQAFAGSPDDVVAGEDYTAMTHIANPLPQQFPEPASVLAWGLVVGGAAWRIRRRCRKPTA